MKMRIVALSLFTVAAMTAMQVKAADKHMVVVDKKMVEQQLKAEELELEMEKLGNLGWNLGYELYEQPRKSARKSAKESAKRLFFYALYASAALFAIEATSLACGYEHGPVYGLLSWLSWLSSPRNDDAYAYDDAYYADGHRFGSHDTPGTAGSVWISAGLSSLAFFSIAAIMLTFWNLKRPRKAGQKEDLFST